MDASHTLSPQGHHLLQIGIALLLFTSLEGFAIPYIRAPRLGLSVHTLGAIEALVLLALGLIWPILQLDRTTATFAFWLFIYSAFATLLPYVLAAVWGAGGSTMPLAAGSIRGTAIQEAIIKTVLYSAAPAAIISLVLIFWGLR